MLDSLFNLFFGLGSGILFIASLIAFAVCVWAIADAAVRPKIKWESAQQSKALWITLIVVFMILYRFAGVFFAIVYLVYIRPKVEAA